MDSAKGRVLDPTLTNTEAAQTPVAIPTGTTVDDIWGVLNSFMARPTGTDMLLFANRAHGHRFDEMVSTPIVALIGSSRSNLNSRPSPNRAGAATVADGAMGTPVLLQSPLMPASPDPAQVCSLGG